MLLSRCDASQCDEDVRLVGRQQPGSLALDGVQRAQQPAVFVEDGDGAAKVIV